MPAYSFSQHRHNYAVWTAARAVQRSLTTTANIKKAIEESVLRDFSESENAITETEFQTFHRKCANQIIMSLNRMGVTNTTYGRAAKIISIYLKTAVILPNSGTCKRSSIIHPPIDSILLKNLSVAAGNKSILAVPWTLLDESGYWSLVLQIKSLPKAFNWTLEEYWRPEANTE